MKLSKYCKPSFSVTVKEKEKQKKELWQFKNLEASLGAYLAFKSKNIDVIFYE